MKNGNLLRGQKSIKNGILLNPLKERARNRFLHICTSKRFGEPKFRRISFQEEGCKLDINFAFYATGKSMGNANGTEFYLT
jgi:hypothetical protein